MAAQSWSSRLLVGEILVVVLLAGCADNGAQVFKREGCGACHRFKDYQGMLGPDLTAVTNRLSDRDIEKYIRNPRNQNPAARMPGFSRLSSQEIKALIRYLHRS